MEIPSLTFMISDEDRERGEGCLWVREGTVDAEETEKKGTLRWGVTVQLNLGLWKYCCYKIHRTEQKSKWDAKPCIQYIIFCFPQKIIYCIVCKSSSSDVNMSIVKPTTEASYIFNNNIFICVCILSMFSPAKVLLVRHVWLPDKCVVSAECWVLLHAPPFINHKEIFFTKAL